MDAEMVPLDGSVRRQWRLEAAGFSIILGLVLVGVSAFLPWGWAQRFALAILIAVAAGSALQWLVAIRYSHWHYGLAEDVLILQRGVFTRRRSMTPYFRVQNVDISQGPLERWLGLKRLTIRTASAFTDASIPGLAGESAEELRIRILERAGRDAAV